MLRLACHRPYCCQYTVAFCILGGECPPPDNAYVGFGQIHEGAALIVPLNEFSSVSSSPLNLVLPTARTRAQSPEPRAQTSMPGTATLQLRAAEGEEQTELVPLP